MNNKKNPNRILESLLDLADSENAAFQKRLTPGPESDSFLGVRVPDLRKLAKTIANTEDAEQFLSKLPHKYFDENMLHAILLSKTKDFQNCIKKIELFLPYIDNWAVCDSLSPEVFKKNKSALIGKIESWIASNRTFTIRFGIEMLMKHFLDDNYKYEYLKLPLRAVSGEYYVNMMIAWFFATALAKQWNDTIEILNNDCLPDWTHNKTIQKACESYRITAEQKEYLKKLKR